MYSYMESILKKYQGELNDYQKILGQLPTDISGRLESILLNPTNERETSFCISCLDFFNSTTGTFIEITKEMEEIEESETVIDDWLDMLDIILRYESYPFETKKEYYERMLELRPELIEQLTTWSNIVLKRVLSNPSNDEEYSFCQKYLEYLSEEVDFKERKDNYLGRLEHRKETLEFLSRIPYKKGLLEILLAPHTDKELEFCIAYFGFKDDKDQIEENVKAGKITPINPNESDAVTLLTSITQVLLEDSEMEDRLFFLRSPEKTADILYELSVLECDQLRLVEAIGNKLGYDFSEEKKANKRLLTTPVFREVYHKYGYARTLIDDLLVYDIDRENKNNKIDKFIRMAECFHSRFIRDVYEAEEPKVKQKQTQEVQGTTSNQ